MGNIDVYAKEYFSNNRIFADIFNYFIYDGNEVLQAEDLESRDTDLVSIPYGSDGADEVMERFRDVMKLAVVKRCGDVAFVLLGIEEQSSIHYAMPVKCMISDAMNYAKQVKESSDSHRKEKDKMSGAEYLSGFTREDRLIPVITLTVYLGSEPWDAPTSLSEMLQDLPGGQELLPFINDYHINLLAPTHISEGEIRKFRTDFGKLLGCLRYMNDKAKVKEYLAKEPLYDRDTAKMLEQLLHIEIKNKEQEVVDMTNGVLELIEDGREEGRLENEVRIIRKKLLKEQSLEEIADALELDVAEIEPMYQLVVTHPEWTDEEIVHVLLERRA